jgi:FAD/FMN-containing dehydrogenase
LIDSQTADVQGGVLWRELLQESLKQNLTPPVLAEFQGITVGGTLSVGGIGVSSPQYGSQCDQVLELDIVTGSGRVLTCSAERNRDLFNAALGGLGQCGIIVRAKMKLVPAPTHAATYLLRYDDLDSYLRDARLIAEELRYEHQQGGPALSQDGSWHYQMEVTKFYRDSQPPDFTRLEAGLRFVSKAETGTSTYWDYLHRTAARVAAGQQLPHPRIEVFIPDSNTGAFIKRVMATPDDYLGAAEFPRFRVFAFNSAPFRQGVFQIPRNDRQFFVVGLLRSADVGDDAMISRMVENNRSWFERVSDAGGKLYPICAVPLSPPDWQAHFGASWQTLAEAKRQYDPRNLLTPGQRMFAR